MPCRYDNGDSSNSSYNSELESDNRQLRSQNSKLEKDLDEVTAIACAALTSLEKLAGEIPLDKSTKAWWKKHREFDKKRQKREELTEKIEKLNAELLKLDEIPVTRRKHVRGRFTRTK